MEIRDKFAIAILPSIYTDYLSECREKCTGPQDENWRNGLAIDAYMMADAMLLMREKNNENKINLFGDMPKFPSIYGELD